MFLYTVISTPASSPVYRKKAMAALMAVLLSLAATGLPGRVRFRPLLRVSTTFSYSVMACMVIS